MRADIGTSSNCGCTVRVQRNARRFAGLCHLHSLLPSERATRAIVKIIARCEIGQFCNEMIDGERQLRVRREAKVRLRAHFYSACGVCSHRLEASLSVRADLRAKLFCKLVLAEQRLDALLERSIIGERVSQVRVANSLGLVGVE